MTWLSIIIAGLLTYFTRMAMIALVSREMLSERFKEVLAYVPSAVFPAIIFPAIFINDYGAFVEIHDPKIFAAVIALYSQIGSMSTKVQAALVFKNSCVSIALLMFSK